MSANVRFSEMSVYGRIIYIVALLMVTISLSYSVYCLFKDQASMTVLKCFRYSDEKIENLEKVPRFWRVRIGSITLANAIYTPERKTMQSRIGWYFAFWFFAVCCIYMLMDLRAAPFLMLGTFAALYYDCTPVNGNTWFPWDMPALFFSSLALFFALRKWMIPLAATLAVGVFFKETVILYGIMILFFEDRAMKNRLIWTGIAIGIAYTIRLAIEWTVNSPLGLGSLSTHVYDNPEKGIRVWKNLRHIFSFKNNHIVWAHLGTIFLLFLLPVKRFLHNGIKAVAIPFYIGLFIWGIFNEMRIFLEILPGALLLLYYFLFDIATKADVDVKV